MTVDGSRQRRQSDDQCPEFGIVTVQFGYDQSVKMTIKQTKLSSAVNHLCLIW
jgi:hypothetical protein